MAGNQGMSGGPMNTIIAGFVGLLVIVAIVILGPVLAGSIQDAVPSATGIETCSYGNPAGGTTSLLYRECDGTGNVTIWGEWNTTHNTGIPTGESMWSTNVVIGGVVILVFFIALAIYYIRIIA